MKSKTVLCLGALSLISWLAFPVSEAAAKPHSAPYYSPSQLSAFQLKPRFVLEGYTGRETLGEAQFLMPLVGSQKQALFTIFEGNLFKGSSCWSAGAGLGWRHTTQSNRIFGGYFMADYNNTEGNHGFLVANPGLESLGALWDFRANGYIPMTNKTWEEKEGWETDIGNYRFADPKGHGFWDHRYRIYGETGRGFDLEIGRAFPKLHGLKFYLAGYRFDLDHADPITGVQGRLEYPFNKYVAVQAIDTYDNNKRNTMLVGIKFNLGAFSRKEKAKFGIATRLLDPIEHNFAVLGDEYTGTPVIPADKNGNGIVEDEGKEEKKYDHVWYFRSGAGTQVGNFEDIENGTAEHPFIGIDQGKVTYIENDPNGGDHAEFFFAPGGYGLGGFADYRMSLPSQYDMLGRTEDYKGAATGNDRADFSGGLDFDGGVNILDAIRLFNNPEGIGSTIGAQNIGLNITNDTVTMKNVTIGTDAESDTSYRIGIMANGATLNATGSQIYAFYGGTGLSTAYDLYGIKAENSTLNFNGGNTITADRNIAAGPLLPDQTVNVYGIEAKGTGVNFNGTGNTVTATYLLTMVRRGQTNVYGIKLSDNSTLDFNSAGNTVNASLNTQEESVDNDTPISYGIYLDHSTLNFNAGNNTVNSINEEFFLTPVEDMYFQTDGIYAGNSTVNFNSGDNTVNSTNTLHNATGSLTSYPSFPATIGIEANASSMVNFFAGGDTVNSAENVNFGGPLNNSFIFAHGIYAANGSTINFSSQGNNINALAIASGGGEGSTFLLSTTGLHVTNSTVNFSQGNNTISAETDNSAGSDLHSNIDGVYFSDSNWNFSGNALLQQNTIRAGGQQGGSSHLNVFGVLGVNSNYTGTSGDLPDWINIEPIPIGTTPSAGEKLSWDGTPFSHHVPW